MSQIALAQTDTGLDSFQALSVPERLALLNQQFGDRLMASTSFGLQAAVTLHLFKNHLPEMPIVFIDTGYHFPETYQYAEELTNLLDLNITWVNPAVTAARQEALYGQLWEQGVEGLQKYAVLNKVEPMNRALQELGRDVWLSGLRRTQSTTREDRAFFEQQRETLKVYPILDWADAQVSAYLHEHQLPPHPLAAKGYVTMGDWHSTSLPTADGDAESTRFSGEKYECGLHEPSTSSDFQI